MSAEEGVAEMKEFLTLLMEVKVTLAEQNGKLDNVLETVGDTKKKVEQTYELAHAANALSKQNEKEILQIKEDLEKKTTKADSDKQNVIRNGLTVVAVLISIVSVVSSFLQ